jgi:hypothetical protein
MKFSIFFPLLLTGLYDKQGCDFQDPVDQCHINSVYQDRERGRRAAPWPDTADE